MNPLELESPNEPVISVVITVYRSENLLEQAIESVLAQSEKNWELILVDNNANEETRQIAKMFCDAFPEKIRIVRESEQGNPSARNRGMIESRGRYIALLDDDDIMYPDRLALQLKAQIDHPNCSIVYGLVDVINHDNSRFLKKNDRTNPIDWKKWIYVPRSGEESRDLFFILPSVMFFRKEIAVQAGLFDVRYNPCFYEDWDFCLRMHLIGPFYEVQKSLVCYRLNDNALSNRKYKNTLSFVKILKNTNQFYETVYTNFYQQKNSFVTRGFRRLRARWLRELTPFFFTHQDGTSLGRLLLRESIKSNPLDYRSWKSILRSYLPASLRKRYFTGVPHQWTVFLSEPIPAEINPDFIKSLYSVHDKRLVEQ